MIRDASRTACRDACERTIEHTFRLGSADADRLLWDGGIRRGQTCAIWDRTGFLGSALAESLVDWGLEHGCSVAMAAPTTEFRLHDRGVGAPGHRGFAEASGGSAFHLTEIEDHDAASLGRLIRSLPDRPDGIVLDGLHWLRSSATTSVPAYLAAVAAPIRAALIMVAGPHRVVHEGRRWTPRPIEGGGPPRDLSAAADVLLEVLGPEPIEMDRYLVRRLDAGREAAVTVRFMAGFGCGEPTLASDVGSRIGTF